MQDEPFDLVVRTLNEEKHIGNLLESLKGQTAQPAEVILVDSGSSDATVDIAQSYGCRIVHIPKDEFTFGRSLNRGIAAGDSPLVVMASAHVLPIEKTWLENLLKPLRDEAACVVSYGKQRGNLESAFSEQQILRAWFPEEDAYPQADPFCNNANCAVRRSEWELHPYDEELAGLEDLAFAKIAQGEGRNISYSAAAGIIHIHDESLAGIVNRYRREAHAYYQLTGDRLSRGSCVGLTCSNVARDLMAAAKRRELRQQSVSIARFRSAQFVGAYQGGKTARDSSYAGELRRRFFHPNRIENRGKNRNLKS